MKKRILSILLALVLCLGLLPAALAAEEDYFPSGEFTAEEMEAFGVSFSTYELDFGEPVYAGVKYSDYEVEPFEPRIRTVTVTNNSGRNMYHVNFQIDDGNVVFWDEERDTFNDRKTFKFIRDGESVTLKFILNSRFCGEVAYGSYLSMDFTWFYSSWNNEVKVNDVLYLDHTVLPQSEGAKDVQWSVTKRSSDLGTIETQEDRVIATITNTGRLSFEWTAEIGELVRTEVENGLVPGSPWEYKFTFLSLIPDRDRRNDMGCNKGVLHPGESVDIVCRGWYNYEYGYGSFSGIDIRLWAYHKPSDTTFTDQISNISGLLMPADGRLTLWPGEKMLPGFPGYESSATDPSKQPETPPVTDPNQPAPWAKFLVDQAIAEGILPAELQNNYGRPITRREFCLLADGFYTAVKGSPAPVNAAVAFTDTSDPAVLRMASVKVVNGVGEGRFDPDGQLTREQAATMLSRLAEALGYPLSESTTSFDDQDSVAGWAEKAVGQMAAANIMNGTGENVFSPKMNYTREQGVVTIMRLYMLLDQ